MLALLQQLQTLVHLIQQMVGAVFQSIFLLLMLFVFIKVAFDTLFGMIYDQINWKS